MNSFINIKSQKSKTYNALLIFNINSINATTNNYKFDSVLDGVEQLQSSKDTPRSHLLLYQLINSLRLYLEWHRLIMQCVGLIFYIIIFIIMNI